MCTRGNGQGAKGNNDVVVVTEGLILWVRGHGYLVCKECLVWHAWRCKCVLFGDVKDSVA